MPTSRLTAATVTLCVAVVVVLTAAPAAAAQEQAPAIDPAALRTFVDGFFTAAVVEEPVPGVAVSAVQGGRTILSAGYGVPEAGGTQEVDPRRTRFRVGELSQVATAVAALQLVETGQLELNVDVNRWLTGVTVPDTYPEPVTLAHLLTHTAGLADPPAATLTRDADEVGSLADVLAAAPLQRVAPPGQVIAYTAQAPALTGLLVEQRSDQRFATYVERNVFARVDMYSTTFAGGDDTHQARGHAVDGGRVEPVPAAHHRLVPALGMTTTARDMAWFTAALLGEGRVGRRPPLLEPVTARLLLQPKFANDERLPSVSYGLAEHVENGVRSWVAAGSDLGFTSLLLLLPDHDFGLFVVFNSDHPSLRARFVRAFFDEFFPEDAPDADPAPGAADLDDYVGSYVEGGGGTTFLRLYEDLVGERRVSVRGDRLLFDGREWRPTDDDHFQSIEDADLHLAFARDEGGVVTHLFPEHDLLQPQVATLFRQPWHRTRGGVATIAAVFAVAFVVVLLVTGWQARRSRGGLLTALRTVARLVAGANLAFMVALPLALHLVGSDRRVAFGVPPAFPVLLSIPVATLVLSLLLAVLAVIAVVRGVLPPARLVWPLIVTAVGAAFAGVCALWGAFGPLGLQPNL